MLKIVLKKCPKIKVISFSKYAARRLDKEILADLFKKNILLLVSDRKGRPPSCASVAQLGRAADLYKQELRLVNSEKSAGRGFDSLPRLFALVAQLVEHHAGNVEVASSILAQGFRGDKNGKFK